MIICKSSWFNFKCQLHDSISPFSSTIHFIDKSHHGITTPRSILISTLVRNERTFDRSQAYDELMSINKDKLEYTNTLTSVGNIGQVATVLSTVWWQQARLFIKWNYNANFIITHVSMQIPVVFVSTSKTVPQICWTTIVCPKKWKAFEHAFTNIYLLLSVIN